MYMNIYLVLLLLLLLFISSLLARGEGGGLSEPAVPTTTIIHTYKTDAFITCVLHNASTGPFPSVLPTIPVFFALFSPNPRKREGLVVSPNQVMLGYGRVNQLSG